MASPTALPHPATISVKERPAASPEVVAPAYVPESQASFEARFRAADLAVTKRLAVVAGICVVIALVAFMVLIAILGANGRQQLGHDQGAAPAAVVLNASA
jgi:hypothetical protein